MSTNSFFLKKSDKKLHNKKMRCTFVPLLGSKCCFSSVVEHFLGKEEVPSSILGNSSKQTMRR